MASRSFTQVGDALTSAMFPHQRVADAGGKGKTSFDLTLGLLRQRATYLGFSTEQLEAVEKKAEAEFLKGTMLCESPIERMILAGLINLTWPDFLITAPPIVHDGRKDKGLPDGDIVIIPQMAFIRHRLDFGLLVELNGRRRLLAVECDGEEFHTNADKDRARDHYLATWDIPVFHISGVEIHRDIPNTLLPIASQIAIWKEAGVDRLVPEEA